MRIPFHDFFSGGRFSYESSSDKRKRFCRTLDYFGAIATNIPWWECLTNDNEVDLYGSLKEQENDWLQDKDQFRDPEEEDQFRHPQEERPFLGQNDGSRRPDDRVLHA